MTYEAILNQLGYTPNEALVDQLSRIEKNTSGYEKIIKHILDLHEALKTDESYVAMSNTNDYFKIKIDATSEVSASDAMDKINHFSEKYKVQLQKVNGKSTYYVIGFAS
ncbi:hypothetical protein [Sulfuricurvum sp.]|uniref:hypothetical protein n=1 Tax=Sulfuricurvum sp. TaxID=2025608 RepID=UPI001995E67D|nr:hypothetical protein [Sulfuricurvum sp.]MBD3799350.1 hypothetical protein [Campylobacterota bacterium]MBD3806760.1 hypothetical protein [Sulfuricurvum sp.]